MVQQREIDPFDALIAQGVTAMEPDPSAEPTLVEPAPKPAPLEPRILFTAPEPAPVSPRWPWLAAGGLVLAGTVAAVLTLTSTAPEPVVVPAPPPAAAVRAPERLRPAVAPAPAPRAKRASRPAASDPGFAAWPGERRQSAPAPRPARGEALKRPSF